MKTIVVPLLLFLLVLCNNSFSQATLNPQQINVDLEQVHKEQLAVIVKTLESIQLQLTPLSNLENIGANEKVTLQNSINAINGFIVNINQQLDAYKNNCNKKIDTDIELIRTIFKGLLSELDRQKILYTDLQNAQTDQLAQKLITQMNLDIKRIEELTQKIDIANATIYQNKDKINLLETDNSVLKKTKDSLQNVVSEQNGKLFYFTHKNFKLGMSFGFNFNSKEYSYITNMDSTVTENKIEGPSGMVSAVLIVQPQKLFTDSNKWQLLLNVPLLEVGLSGDNSTVSSVFNKQVSLGLGIGYEFANNISVVGLVNLRRIKKIDNCTLQQRNDKHLFNEPAFTVIGLDKYATINVPNITYTVGIVIKF